MAILTERRAQKAKPKQRTVIGDTPSSLLLLFIGCKLGLQEIVFFKGLLVKRLPLRYSL